MVWTVETLNEIVDEELDNLPADMQARFVHIARLIEAFGPTQVREPHVKHIRGPLYEMRMRGKAGISRALYVTAKSKRVVVVRVFVKKTQKTPEREIRLALKRAKEIEQ
jgi:phage-related protein